MKKVPENIIDNLLTSKRSLSEFIEGMNLCGDASAYYNGTTITSAASDTSQKANWIMTFLTEMTGRSGWPTKKQLASDVLSEIQNLSAYYTGHTWAENAVDSIDDWINGIITDDQLNEIGKGYMKTKPYGAEDEKNVKLFDAIICTCVSAKKPTALGRATILIAQSVNADSSKTNNVREELVDITGRIGPSKYINSTITDQID